ncbi:hypothetical protein A3A60_02760 [Candidatus Curtissbacteria bacterium RIFCSPLOWO2_01_FULL_42_26]|uniref:Transposase IS200-like domain-containing protein n=1 Tax=Candidatus Curtissbacteria bacterium RIFCSPLOWO2_01_FULL_42_26 TaxID=1797729 RepID=A0A1F5HY16_9BACT|nr:MAG: hypothetical protein A3A60_02760 [Candidatus Curtissbacteria bacterium RIFCSPLOWO2_01_FULL_42_26]
MYRKDLLITGHIYHIFNRGVNKATIFYSEDDYRRFYETAIHYLNKRVKYSSSQTFSDTVSLDSADTVSEENDKVEVLAYCLMPNHFHFLVKQIADGGITDYFRHLLNAYSHYVNIKYKRIGPLFQGPFRNLLVETDEQLVHLSRYIHLNPLVAGLVADARNYMWSSYMACLGEKKNGLCDGKIIKGYFKSAREYEKFVLDQADYARELERIKHLTVDYA